MVSKDKNVASTSGMVMDVDLTDRTHTSGHNSKGIRKLGKLKHASLSTCILSGSADNLLVGWGTLASFNLFVLSVQDRYKIPFSLPFLP